MRIARTVTLDLKDMITLGKKIRNDNSIMSEFVQRRSKMSLKGSICQKNLIIF